MLGSGDASGATPAAVGDEGESEIRLHDNGISHSYPSSSSSSPSSSHYTLSACLSLSMQLFSSTNLPLDNNNNRQQQQTDCQTNLLRFKVKGSLSQREKSHLKFQGEVNSSGYLSLHEIPVMRESVVARNRERTGE